MRYQVERKFHDSVWEPSKNGNNNSQFDSLSTALKAAEEWTYSGYSQVLHTNYRVVDTNTGRVVTGHAYVVEQGIMLRGKVEPLWLETINSGYSDSFTKERAVDFARAQHLNSVYKLPHRVVNKNTGKVVYRVSRIERAA